MSYNLLRGKKGVIFGALNQNSIAWQVAERCFEEGAEILLTNAPVALRMGDVDELAKKLNTQVIPADATSIEDLENLFKTAIDKFGGKIDFVLVRLVCLPMCVRVYRTDNSNYDYYLKTLDISALSFHKMLQTCKTRCIREWASVIALSYIAEIELLSVIMIWQMQKLYSNRSLVPLAIFTGSKKVRINTVSQSPTMTTAGSGIKGFDSLFDFSERMSPLGNASARECADYCVTLFSDLTRKVTMQNLYHDGGFSSMAMSEAAIRQYEKSFQNDVN